MQQSGGPGPLLDSRAPVNFIGFPALPLALFPTCSLVFRDFCFTNTNNLKLTHCVTEECKNFT
jgi:hypothetical protein